MNLDFLKNIDLQKLKNINLKEFDLKQIDFEELKERASERRDLVVSGTVILLTIFLFFSMASNRITEIKNTSEKVESLEEKILPAQKLKKELKKTEEYLKTFPINLASQDLVQFLNEEAFNFAIRIVSFSPSREKIENYFKLKTISITCEVNDYQNLYNFISSIEESEYALRLIKILAESKFEAVKNRRRTNKKEINAENLRIEVVLEIATIELLENETES